MLSAWCQAVSSLLCSLLLFTNVCGRNHVTNNKSEAVNVFLIRFYDYLLLCLAQNAFRKAIVLKCSITVIIPFFFLPVKLLSRSLKQKRVVRNLGTRTRKILHSQTKYKNDIFSFVFVCDTRFIIFIPVAL